MASNTGIEFYPFNVDFFDDDKIALIEGEFGMKGSVIAIRLLCKIYREGYYYKWGDDECLIFAKKTGADIVPNTIREVVNGLLRRSFFDKGVFEQFGILTSRGIQQRYFDAVRRRQKVEAIKEYLLIDVSKFPNVILRSLNAPETTAPATPKPKVSKPSFGVAPITVQPLLRPIPPSYDSIDKEIEELQKNEIWMENVAMRFHLSSLEEVAKRLSEFAIDCRSRGTLRHDTLQDAQRHFNDWLRIQINITNQQASVNNGNNNNIRKQNEKRRANTTVSAKAEDFKTSF